MSWSRATVALRCLAAGGRDLGGLWLRARSGPARDTFLGALPPHVRIHPDSPVEALFGGLDLAQTLATGRSVTHAGSLAAADLIVLSGAERCPPALAARLGQHLDVGGAPIIALDESDGEDVPPSALTDRLGLFVSLADIALSDLSTIDVSGPCSTPPVEVTDDLISAIAVTAATLGIVSMRPPRFALAATRAMARLNGRAQAAEADARAAVDLTLAHRALAQPDAADAPPPAPDSDRSDADAADGANTMGDRLVGSARTALPPGVLTALASARDASASGSGAGASKINGQRGRPRPARPGRASQGRIDTVATLRAAAPWQKIRRTARPDDLRPVLIAPSDIRLRRFQQDTQRLVIFVLDASGSAAMARLAEAKGAIELLLSDAYAERDHVAVVAFRQDAAQCLLPPTGSLTRAKKALAGLPGGGGTPLAAGLDMGLALALQARRGARSPSLVLLTDGKANMTQDGRPDRKAARSEAEVSARRIAASGVPVLMVDTGVRPNSALRALAGIGNARYIALPRAGSDALAAAVLT